MIRKRERITRERLAFLAEMNSLEIAALFYSENVRGVPATVMSCPVALYLARNLNVSPIMVSVGTSDVSVYCGLFAGHVRVNLPSTVREFIHRFDRGSFTELKGFHR